MIRGLCILLSVTVPTLALAQTPPPASAPAVTPPPPPPPSYPPVYPPAAEPPPSYPPGLTPAPPLVAPPPAPYAQPQPNLRPYAPVTPGVMPSGKSELPLDSGELLASVAVTAAASVGAYLAANAANSSPGGADAAVLILILFSAVMPIFAALPVWGLSFLSDTYEVRFWPMVEAGSTVAGISVLLILIAEYASWQPLLYIAAVGLVLGVPLTEVIEGNVTKLPKGMGFNMYGSSAPLWDAPPTATAWSGPPLGKLFMLPLPALTF